METFINSNLRSWQSFRRNFPNDWLVWVCFFASTHNKEGQNNWSIPTPPWCDSLFKLSLLEFHHDALSMMGFIQAVFVGVVLQLVQSVCNFGWIDTHFSSFNSNLRNIFTAFQVRLWWICSVCFVRVVFHFDHGEICRHLPVFPTLHSLSCLRFPQQCHSFSGETCWFASVCVWLSCLYFLQHTHSLIASCPVFIINRMQNREDQVQDTIIATGRVLLKTRIARTLQQHKTKLTSCQWSTHEEQVQDTTIATGRVLLKTPTAHYSSRRQVCY